MALDLDIGTAIRDRFALRRTYTLEGVDITLDLRWHPRAAGWYLGILDADGVQRSSGRRVEPGAPLIPDRTWATLPPGQIVAVGAVDLTRREYLGEAVRLVYLTAAEWSQVTSP